MLARSSSATPVSVHVCVPVLSLKMWKSALAVSHMLAHQNPSFHQSLLSGLEPVGAEPEPADEGPS